MFKIFHFYQYNEVVNKSDGVRIKSVKILAQTSNTKIAKIPLKYSAFNFDPILTPIWAPITPPRIIRADKTISTFWFKYDWKKVELAVRNIIHGQSVNNKSALMNPTSLKQFVDLKELNI